MRTAIVLIIALMTPGFAHAYGGPSVSSMMTSLSQYEEDHDDLGMRILIKRLGKMQLSYSQWTHIRRLLHRRPGIGYSLVFKWDSIPFKDNRDSKVKKTEERVNQWLRLADDRMAAGQFQTAFTMYQKAANTLKPELNNGKSDNQLLFQSVLHAMARALYGAGRFDESLNVYGWISRNYPRYRQVLFEKMWAAFRAHHADIALGAIASQRSAFFSDYMEPESYLVQIYLYKKLCREDELTTVRKAIVKYRENLNRGTYSYEDWARSDLENYSLLRLTKQKVREREGPVTHSDALKEQEVIRRALMAKYNSERRRLLTELNQVLAYTYLGVSADALKLQGEDLDRSRLRKGGQEYWPADDSEDWADEIGSHLYIGASQCGAK